MRRKIARYSNTKKSVRCQILVLRDYRFQFNIKILSEGFMITNFISKSLEFIELLICDKIVSTVVCAERSVNHWPVLRPPHS